MKRSPHLRQLSVEHQDALSFAARLERAAHAEALSKLSSWTANVDEYWHAELRRHFAVEERVWLPALAEAGLRALTERTTTQHEMIAAVATDPCCPCGGGLLASRNACTRMCASKSANCSKPRSAL
ncbi:MAG: hemerythrin domain-containing protein [Rhodospirillaceae bacterium]